MYMDKDPAFLEVACISLLKVPPIINTNKHKAISIFKLWLRDTTMSWLLNLTIVNILGHINSLF